MGNQLLLFSAHRNKNKTLFQLTFSATYQKRVFFLSYFALSVSNVMNVPLVLFLFLVEMHYFVLKILYNAVQGCEI